MPHRKIRRKRKEHGLSQDEMADRLGISPSAYGKLERGETRIDIERLKQIAETLGTDLMDFLENETVVVTNNNDNATGNNGIAIQPSYHNSVEVWQKLVVHLEEEVALLRKDKETLHKDKEQLIKLLEKFTA